jgi:hypothetical protein
MPGRGIAPRGIGARKNSPAHDLAGSSPGLSRPKPVAFTEAERFYPGKRFYPGNGFYPGK